MIDRHGERGTNRPFRDDFHPGADRRIPWRDQSLPVIDHVDAEARMLVLPRPPSVRDRQLS